MPVRNAGRLAVIGVVAIAMWSCSAISLPTYGSSAAGKYDGTYDFSGVRNTPTGTTTFVAPPAT